MGDVYHFKIWDEQVQTQLKEPVCEEYELLADVMVNENPTPTMHLEYSLLLRHTFQKFC